MGSEVRRAAKARLHPLDDNTLPRRVALLESQKRNGTPNQEVNRSAIVPAGPRGEYSAMVKRLPDVYPNSALRALRRDIGLVPRFRRAANQGEPKAWLAERQHSRIDAQTRTSYWHWPSRTETAPAL